MENDSEKQDPFAHLNATWNHPNVQRCLREIELIAGYVLPIQQRGPFLFYHSFITSTPSPKFIALWRSEPKLERWYHRHVNGILGHVQNAMACVWYHHDNLIRIEEHVRRIIIDSKAQLALRNCTIGLGNTIAWDAEYQAFILAVRRCLDYLARGIASYFRNDHHSFRKLPEFLAHVKPVSVALALNAAYERHESNFQYVLSDGKKKSIRDLLSHYEYISAGALNISDRGFLLQGGGEGMKSMSGAWDGALGAIIKKRADELHSCIADFLTSFVVSVREFEKSY